MNRIPLFPPASARRKLHKLWYSACWTTSFHSTTIKNTPNPYTIIKTKKTICTNNRHVTESQVTIRLEINRHIKEVKLIRNHRIENPQHLLLRETTDDSSPSPPLIWNVLQHQRQTRVLARPHLLQVDHTLRVVHATLRLLPRKHARIHILRHTSQPRLQDRSRPATPAAGR